MSERRYGAFQRDFDLPDGVDTEKIAATFRNGVLKVTLPKTAEAQKPAKKIEVSQPPEFEAVTVAGLFGPAVVM